VRPRRVVVASQNLDKIREVEAIVAIVAPEVEIMRGLKWPDVAETESSLQGNAILKAKAVAGYTGLAALADDTGLEVEALGGAPGVMTARFAGLGATYKQNVDLLLQRLDGADSRKAVFRTVIALVDPRGSQTVSQGVLHGRITCSPRGMGGFGYDSVFEVDGKTLAEMPPSEKNKISHRALALHSLVSKVWGGGTASQR